MKIKFEVEFDGELLNTNLGSRIAYILNDELVLASDEMGRRLRYDLKLNQFTITHKLKEQENEVS